MELKLSHESICINEVVFDSTLDLPIELDYLLPDYCQSVFKVLKCKITPKITSQRIANGKLIIDGVACIKVIYTSEECYKIRSVTQKQIFSKSVDLKEPYENGNLTVFCKCDYVNCRVVNQHRLDIRGAVSLKATISVCRRHDVLSNACGMGVQICNKKVTTLGQKLNVCKEFTIKEELELSYGKPPIVEILAHEASAVATEYKVIPNKVIVKGEILLHLLYAHSDEDKPEIMDYNIPLSQIIDLNGINEDYKCIIALDIIGVEINLKGNSEGGDKCFDVEFCIRASLEADKNDDVCLVNDVYSTDYKLDVNIGKIKVEELITVINESCIAKSQIKIPQSEIICVYDIMCDFSNAAAKITDDTIEITGNLNTSVLALDCDNMPVMLDRSTACAMKLDCHCCDENTRFSPIITVSGISYSMLGGDEIEIRAEVKVCGNLLRCSYYNVVSAITVDESAKKTKNDDVALRLYFAQCGEVIWDIAKKFNTSVDLILAENSVGAECVSEDRMLLIPN